MKLVFHINRQNVGFILKRVGTSLHKIYDTSRPKQLIRKCRSCNKNYISNSLRHCLGNSLQASHATVISTLKISEIQMASGRECVVGNSTEQSSKTDFDMTKIVHHVKSKMQEKRKEKKKKKNNQFGNSFGLEMLFADSQSSCEEKIKTTKNISSNLSESSESSELQHLFKDDGVVIKRNKRKRKYKKQKQNDIDHFGLKWLFGEKNERKRKNGGKCEDDEETRVKKKKANYFFAIRVSDPQIHANVGKIQASIVKENKKLQDALIPLPTLHLTMTVMHIEDKILIEGIESALEKYKTDIVNLLETVDFKIKFSGVGDFRKEVVFVKVQEEYNDCLRNINNILTCALQDVGIIVDEKDWKAHLTLLKLSRKRSLMKKGIKKVDKQLYSSWIDSYFGEEQISNISLCSMFEPKDEGGYYKCVVNIILNRPDPSRDGILRTDNDMNKE